MEKNKTKSYFLYALGEVLLVVIGILIALQINNWNEDKIGKELEQVYLQNLIVDLENQLSEQERQRQGEQYTKEALNRIGTALNNGFKNADLLRFNQDMQSIIITRTLNLYDATFDDLKSTGNMNLIRNEKLKQNILDYFQFSNRNVYVIRKNAEGYHHAFIQAFMNSQLANFDLRGMNDTVKDYSAIFDSINVVRFKLEVDSLFNVRLAKRLADIDNQQIVKNVITNRRWTNEASLFFLKEMKDRTNELIEELKKELK